MPEIITCPECRRRYFLPEHFAGGVLTCPGCHFLFEAEPLSAVLPMGLPVAEPVPPPAPRVERPFDWSGPPAQPRPAGPAPVVIGRKQKVMAIVAGICVSLVYGAIFYFTGAANPQPRRPWIPPDDPQAARQEVLAAFQNLPVEGELADSIKSFFDEVQDAAKAKDGNRLASQFDLERMFDEIAGQIQLPPQSQRQRNDFITGMRQGVQRSMPNAPLFQWTSAEIHSIRRLPNNELVVIARHRDPKGVSMKVRWWLIWRGNGWRIYDFEDLGLGGRASMVASTLIAPLLDGRDLDRIRQLGNGAQLLQQAFVALIQEDAQTAEKKLKQIAQVPFPPIMEAVRCLAHAQLHILRGEFQQALKRVEQAERLQPDMPIVEMLKGVIYNQLDQRDLAIQHLEAYQKLLGDDVDVCFQLGLALHNQRRFVEAQVQYRKALDDDPHHFDAFRNLLRAHAPQDDAKDLGWRFARLDQPALHFDEAAEECRENRDGIALEQICLAMQKIDRRFSPADYNLVLAKAWQGQFDQVLPLWQTALARDPAPRQFYLQELATAFAQAGKALQAYQTLPEPRDLFAPLAAGLMEAHRPDDLKKLLAAHAPKFPDDPLLPFYRGEVHAQNGLFHLADQAFQAGLAKPPEAATLELFRRSRISARFYTGHALEAYAQFAASEETFSHLANLALSEDQLDVLEKLIALHAKKNLQSVALLRYQCRLKARQNKPAEAVAAFKPALDQLMDDAREDLIFDFLDDMADAGHTLQAYQAAPDKSLAFQTLGNRLLSKGRDDELRRLIEAHRPPRRPYDPWLLFFEGELRARQKSWDDALPFFRQALTEAAKEQRPQFRYRYLQALYQAGKDPLQAYRDLEDDARQAAFMQLSHLLAQDKKGAELQALVEAHRPHAKEAADLLSFEARARILQNQPAEAVPLMQKAYELAKEQFRRRGIVTQFATDMAEAGHARLAYLAAPDAALAFETLANRLVYKKNAPELDQLVQAHAKDHADDPLLPFFRAELALLQDKPKAAEELFAAGLADAKPMDENRFRYGLFRARVQLGRTADTYREFGDQYFDMLANLCTSQKKAAELEALVAARRQAQPDDGSLPSWDLDVRWLKQDYPGVLKLIAEHRQGLFGLPRFRWKAENYQVRCLVRLKRFPEAIQEAERITRHHQGNGLLLVLAHTASGDLKQATAALERSGSSPWLIRSCYDDEDLGPIIQTDPFKDFRAKYPKPAENFREILDGDD